MNPHTASSASAARGTAWRRLNQLRLATAPDSGEPENAEIPEAMKLADRRDRAQANRLVRGVLQNLSLLDAWLGQGRLFDLQKTPPAILWVLRLAVYEKIFQSSVPDYAIGNQAVELARRAGGPRAARFVNAIMRRLLPTLPDSPDTQVTSLFWATLPDAVRWSVPEPIISALAQGYGKDSIAAVIRALSGQESPLWLRVNTLKTTEERLVTELEQEGVKINRLSGTPEEALLWGPGSSLPWETEPWRQGHLTVQDLGAMLAARLLDPLPGQRVLDSCAAPGGKTGHLWERMKSQGQLVALEVNPARRNELRQSLARLYSSSSGLIVPDWNELKMVAAEDPFDRILIDAPCQGLGLLRRHPEIRWDGRLRFQQQMQATQRQILEDGANCVKPGGALLWVTCSPTTMENEEIVFPWLQAHTDWRLVNPELQLPRDWLFWMQNDQGVLRTRPDLTPCDGFALTLIQRIG